MISPALGLLACAAQDADGALVQMVESLNASARVLSPQAEGACLPTTAAGCFVLGLYGVDVVAVRGTFAGADHWWMRSGEFVL